MSSGSRTTDTLQAKLNELEMRRHVHGKGASRTQTDWLLRICNELLNRLHDQAARFDEELAAERKRAMDAESRIIRARRHGWDV